MGKTKIEWTDETWNPIRHRDGGHGCVKTSPGCQHCYSERLQPRFGQERHFDAESVKGLYLDERVLLEPLRWKKPRMVFPCSMTDMFGDWVSHHTLDRIFAVMAMCPDSTFQILTKRADRMRDYVRGHLEPRKGIEWLAANAGMYISPRAVRVVEKASWPLPNVWLGVSAENQQYWDQRVPELVRTPAAVRFVSYEPALGPVHSIHSEAVAGAMGEHALLLPCEVIGHPRWLPNFGSRLAIDWVICGGESGPHARPMHPDWARSMRDQCLAREIRFHFKQWGEWLPTDGPTTPAVLKYLGSRLETAYLDEQGKRLGIIGSAYNHTVVTRVGKREAGRLLDGREWNEYPQRIHEHAKRLGVSL